MHVSFLPAISSLLLPVEREGLVDEIVGTDVLRVEFAPERVKQPYGVSPRQPPLVGFQGLRVSRHLDLSPVRVDVGWEPAAHLSDELRVVSKLALDSGADRRIRYGQVHDHSNPGEDVVNAATGGRAHAALRRPCPALLDRRRGGETRRLDMLEEVDHETDVRRRRFHLSLLALYCGGETIKFTSGEAHLKHQLLPATVKLQHLRRVSNHPPLRVLPEFCLRLVGSPNMLGIQSVELQQPVTCLCEV
mmetsp:Transcript_32658/g.60735  ORF Transcript_32658/g.60735 Transcript_32658/m.60735 type:complete len:247 (+) Transcript_32658:49-789(+)